MPKYIQLAEQLRAQVERGERKPGEQLPTFAQMRAEYGLGQATLERVYSLLEEENLIVRTPGKGTFVADIQKRGTAGVLGIVACRISEQHPYYAHLLRGVRNVARSAGWELLLTHEKASIKWEKVDGVLICSAYLIDTLRRLPPGMPRVSLLNPSDNAPYVGTSDYDGIRQAMSHLLELGHRRIGYMTMVNPRSKESVQQQRLRGYREALQEAGITPDPAWLRPLRAPFEPMQKWEILGHSKMRQWLGTDWKQTACTAVLAHNDETAIGIVEALQEAGLKVPRDVSVVGFDGTEIAEYFRPRLTTVKVPLEEIGATGAGFLLDMVRSPLGEKKPPIPAVTQLPIQLSVGESTAVAR